MDCQFLAESSVYPDFFAKNEATLALNMLDLQLMHHFATSTYATLFVHPPMRHFWRDQAVRIGLRCDYVMRAILAVSALHLAHHSPERRELYTSTALTYHRVASKGAMSLMTDVKEEDAGNLFVFSVLTIFFGSHSSYSLFPTLAFHGLLSTDIEQQWAAQGSRPRGFSFLARVPFPTGCFCSAGPSPLSRC